MSSALISRNQCYGQHDPGISSRTFKTVVADGQALPFADGTFDAVVCQLGLQFFCDAVRGLEESRGVLAAGRYAAVCVQRLRLGTDVGHPGGHA